MENKTELKILPSGSLQIKGNFIIIDQAGQEIKATDPAFLCTCGKSNIKPFCDGSHKSSGSKGWFKSS
jgi:CDGSH-type Zn-finger protein